VLKTGLTGAQSKSIISKTIKNIKVKFCMLLFGYLSTISCKFHQIFEMVKLEPFVELTQNDPAKLCMFWAIIFMSPLIGSDWSGF